MAYFANGSEQIILDDQCGKCKLGDKPCPIAFVQVMYNYDAINNDVATEILDHLVDAKTGKCKMLKLLKEKC